MPSFADVCRRAYENRSAIDSIFLVEYKAKSWPRCRKIIENDCFLVAHYQAFLLVRKWFNDDEKESAIADMAINAVETVLRQIRNRTFNMTGTSICNYLWGIVNNERSKLGLTFRRKDFPSKIKTAGQEAVELYAWRVKMKKSREECRSLLAENFGVIDADAENLFSLVEPHATRTRAGKSDVISLDGFGGGDQEQTSYEIPDHRSRPDELLHDKEITRILESLISRLPPKEAQIIRWIYEDGEKNVAAKIKKHFNVKSEYYEKNTAKEAFRTLCQSMGIDATYFN